MEAAALEVVSTINGYLSNYVLLFLLVGTGLFFTIRTRFVQIRCFAEGWRRMFGGFSLRGGKQESGMSSFQALATAIAAQVGTGNIVGACGAILAGGPGAILWMWIIAFLGMATNYAEAVLAQMTKKVDEDGAVHGGPVYYIRTAFKGGLGKFLAAFFAVAIILSLGFMGCMVQSNSIASTCSTAFGVAPWIVGIIIALVAGFVFVGGVSRIASVTEKLVPLMAVIYLVGGLIVLCTRLDTIPATFALIFESAFNPEAYFGGAVGGIIAAMTQGAKRGLFSNEAGMGSTPHAHAQANVKDPHEQGTVAMIGVFIDTFVVLTITALTVVITLYTKGGILADGTIPEAINKTNLAQTAFGTLLGEAGGNIFIAIALFFFAFSTVLGWNMFGKINVAYLFGKKAKSEKIATTVYNVISLAFIFLGTLASNDLVWELSDMFNQLMVIPNVIGLIACGGLVVSLTHFNKKKDQIKVVE